MYYVIEKGTELFQKIWDLNERIYKAHIAAGEVVKELGEEGWYSYPWGWGGVAAVEFKNNPPPQHWVKNTAGGHRPHATRKATKEIRDRIDALPIIKAEEVGRMFGINAPLFHKGRMYNGPRRFRVGCDFVIYEVSSELADVYEKPDDATEIVLSEYKKYNEKVDQEQEKLKVVSV